MTTNYMNALRKASHNNYRTAIDLHYQYLNYLIGVTDFYHWDFELLLENTFDETEW